MGLFAIAGHVVKSQDLSLFKGPHSLALAAVPVAYGTFTQFFFCTSFKNCNYSLDLLKSRFVYIYISLIRTFFLYF